MDASTTTTNQYDNGITPTPVILLPTTIPTPINALMESSDTNSFTSTIPEAEAAREVFTTTIPLLPATSGRASTTAGTGKSKTNSYYNTHTNKDLHNMQQQESTMSYERSVVRDGLTALAVILFVLGLVGFTGFLTSRRFRRWREGRSSDSKTWEISRHDFHEEESFNPPAATRQLSTTGTTLPTTSTNNNKTTIPKQFTRGWSVPVEQIDEERGWLWGTNTTTTTSHSQSLDEKEVVQSVTPGLGIGKYRSKKYSSKSCTSTGSRDTVLRLSEPEGYFKKEPDNHQQQQQNHSLEVTDRSTPRISFLLTRLKQSLTARSRFNTNNSGLVDSHQNNYLPSKTEDDDDDDNNDSQLINHSQRCLFNEVGQLIVKQEDISNSIIMVDEEEEESTELISSSSSSPKPQIELNLPDLPPLAWDTIQTNKTKRTIDLIHPISSSSSNKSHSQRKRSDNSFKFNHYISASNKSRRQRNSSSSSSGFNNNNHHLFIVKSKKKVTACSFV